MGSDATKINPEKKLYFKPTDPLALGDNQKKYEATKDLINSVESKKFEVTDITNIWERVYPLGMYDVVYLKSKKGEAAAYIITKGENKVIIKYLESKEKNIN